MYICNQCGRLTKLKRGCEKLTSHVHDKEKKEWAKGKKIQFLSSSGWTNADNPSWNIYKKYRVAP